MAELRVRSKAGPSRRDPAATKARILKAGLKLFSDRGPDATTVEMLAKSARINRRMLYHYFGSKEGLYRAVIRRMYEKSSELEIELSHLMLPAEELLGRLIRAHFEFLSGNPEFVRLLSWENLRHGRTTQKVDLSGLKAPAIQALRLVLNRGKKEGVFRNDLDENQLFISCLALSFFYFSNRYTVSQTLGVDLAKPKAIESRIRHVSELLLDGIRAPEKIVLSKRKSK